MQMPMEFMIPQCDWRPTPVSQLPSWEGAKRVSIDLETRDPELKTLGPGVRRGGYVCGIAFKIEDGPEHYLPIRHSEDNLPEEQVWAYMREQSERMRGLVLGANLPYDLDYLWENGVLFPNIAGYRDIQVNEPLIDDLQDSYSLENIAQRYGLPGKDLTLLKQACEGWGVHHTEMHKIPGRFAAQYALQDVRLPLIIARRQERKLEEKDEDGFDLLRVHDLECRLLPVLVRMRRRGVRVSLERLERFRQLTIVEQAKAIAFVKDQTGLSLGVDDVNRPAALVAPLGFIGVRKEDIPLTPKTKQPSIDNDMLRKLKHPVADAILRARKVSKLRTTFVDGIMKHMVKGRIHSTFNQLRTNKSDDENDDGEGARYGRISSTDPNMQQQPNPDKDPEFGKAWRAIYLPEEGMEWFANDYRAQEPRQLVHFAEVCGCPKAAEVAERYRVDLSTDPHTLVAQLIAGAGPDWKPSKQERSEAKIIGLGLAYGMGGAKLARSLGLPTEWKFIERLGRTIEVAGPEAQSKLDQFHAGVPYVRDLAQKCQAAARSRGYIRTLMGRRCHFPEKPLEDQKGPNDKYDWLHKALNRLVQGSSADQTKLATVLVDGGGHFLQLQVHDELDGSCRDRGEGEAIGDLMRNCVKLRVPCLVDVEVGPSWGECT